MKLFNTRQRALFNDEFDKIKVKQRECWEELQIAREFYEPEAQDALYFESEMLRKQAEAIEEFMNLEI